MNQIFAQVGCLIKTQLKERVNLMFNNREKIKDDEFAGFGSYETLKLVEFNFDFMQQFMILYGN